MARIAQEVAARWMLASMSVKTGTSQELKRLYEDYQKFLLLMRKAILTTAEERYIDGLVNEELNYYKRRYPMGVPAPVEKKIRKQMISRRSRYFQRDWVMLTDRGERFMELALGTVAIPRGQAKKVQAAARLFIAARRVPQNIYTWMRRNEKNLDMPATMVKWPEKDEVESDIEEKFKIGPLVIHNTIQLEGKKLDDTKKILRKIVRLIKSSKVTGALKTLYGDVLVVAKLNQPKVMAWYNPRKDDIWIRHLKEKDLHNGIHEFGHRLWRKFLPREMISKWQQYHAGKRWDHPDVEMPKVGDPLPVKVRGHKDPRVVKIQGDKYFITEKGFLTWKQIRNYLETDVKFPTIYAATDAEEHFCEAFALYCQGTLKPEFLENFEAIFK